MAHVLKVIHIGTAKYVHCECGRTLTVLYEGYSEEQVVDMVQGHRIHVLEELNVPAAWREGSTTQAVHPINPLLGPDLKHAALTSQPVRPD